MKISFCLFGQGRYVETCFPQIFDKILSKYDCDVFCQLWWDQNVIENGYQGWRSVFKVPENTPSIIESLYKPKKFLIQESITYKNRLDNDDFIEKYPILRRYEQDTLSHNTISQILAFQNVFELFDWNDYDLIIRWRYDIFPKNFPNLHELDRNMFYPGYSQYPTFFDESERFTDVAFIMPKTFFPFTRIFENFVSGNFSPSGMNGESFYNEFLKKLGWSEKIIKLHFNKFQIELVY